MIMLTDRAELERTRAEHPTEVICVQLHPDAPRFFYFADLRGPLVRPAHQPPPRYIKKS